MHVRAKSFWLNVTGLGFFFGWVWNPKVEYLILACFYCLAADISSLRDKR